jgi:predicted enzyme related to lactoylglutathione lyase
MGDAMSERDGYQHGVPCWVDVWRDDPEATASFYAGLFGWETEGPPASEPGPRYFMCRLRGRDVAGIGAPAPEGVGPGWITYVWVDNADEAAARAVEAGGRVLTEPFDSLDGGRMAVLADPAGASFAVWQLGEHRGAELVNESSAWAMSLLHTNDPEGAKAFYGAVLGWESDTFDMGDTGELTMWRVPGYVGGEPEQPVSREVVGVMATETDAPPQWTVNFWVDDADAAAARAAELGGGVVSEPHDIPGFREAVVTDPSGAAVSLSALRLEG